jgi:hypothetical protein
MAKHRDELTYSMQEAGDALGLFHEDGTLKSFDEIIEEAAHKVQPDTCVRKDCPVCGGPEDN